VHKIPARPAAAYGSESCTLGKADERACSREGSYGVSLRQCRIKSSGERGGILNYIKPRSRKCGSIHPLPYTSSWRNA
jgi:hypothetical protein